MKIGSYETHPAADLFPMVDGERAAELAADVKRRGLLRPIAALADDGRIIDGRNRLQACLDAGVEPRFEHVRPEDPYAYVWSLNGARRDLEPGQRAQIYLECEEGSNALIAERERTRIASTTRARDDKGRLTASRDAVRTPAPTTHALRRHSEPNQSAQGSLFPDQPPDPLHGSRRTK